MTVRVLFDSVELNTDYIYELSRQYALFGDNFELGCTPAQSYTLVIDKLGVTDNPNPTTVTIYDEATLVATLQVDNIEESDQLTLKYELVDSMVNFNFYYDASPLMPVPEGDETPDDSEYPTLLEVVQDICSQAGVTLNSNYESFYGADKVIKWYDSTITAREYIGFVAELNAGYACINESGELVIYSFTNQVDQGNEIAIEDCENFVLGQQYTITRVVYDNASGVKWVYGNEEGATVYLNINNGFIEAETDVRNIYNLIAGFSFYNISVDNCPYLDRAFIGGLIEFYDSDGYYDTICEINQSYAGDSWFGGYKLNIASPKQAETTVQDTMAQNIKNIKTIIDRNNAELSTTITNIQTNLEGKIEGASSTWSQSASGFRASINEINSELGNYSEYFDFTANGLLIGREGSDIKGRYGDSGIAFINASNTELAWLNTGDGLGAPKITIGADSTTTNRWQWITSADGSHSRFTRHE